MTTAVSIAAASGDDTSQTDAEVIVEEVDAWSVHDNLRRVHLCDDRATPHCRMWRSGVGVFRALFSCMDASHSSDVDGVRIHWTESGSGIGKVPLILLHGLSDSHMTWQGITHLLATDRRVLMPDAPGSGRSGRPDASYELAWHARTIARWVESLGLKEIDVVGHSFGGGVAQMLLLEPNLTIRRLGLIASGGIGPRIGLWLRLAALPRVVEYFGQPFMAAGTRLAMRAANSCILDADLAALSAMNAQPGTARAFARTVHDVISWRGQSRHFLQGAYEIPKLPPITLFWGDRDGITPIADALGFVRCVEGVGFESFEGCGHYVHHEAPEALAIRLRAFLDAPVACPAQLPLRRAPAASWRQHWVDVLVRFYRGWVRSSQAEPAASTR